jgi:hypothetical protein
MEYSPDASFSNAEALNPEAESVESISVERIEERITAIEDRLAKIKESGLEGDISPETTEKIAKKAGILKKLAKYASIGMAMYGAAEYADYQATRNSISIEKKADGTLHFEHSDPETTRIMEYLTGEKPLPEEDRIFFYRQIVREKLRSVASLDSHDGGIDWLSSLEEKLPTDEAGLRARMIELLKTSDNIFGDKQGNYDARVTTAFEDEIKSPVPYDPVIATVLWRLQAKVGAPRIRWEAPGQNTEATLSGKVSGAGRAHYNSETNTVYITPGTVGETLVAEDSHALQFDQHPIRSRVQFVLDMTRTVVGAYKEHTTVYDQQLKEYRTLGTLEYDAHSVIQPRLIKEMEDGE